MRLVVFISLLLGSSTAFSPINPAAPSKPWCSEISSLSAVTGGSDHGPSTQTRRNVIERVAGAVLTTAAGGLTTDPAPAIAAVGSLSEFSDSNAMLSGITVNVVDKSQEDLMLNFLQDAFDFQILRKKKEGSVTDTWLGFGPEQLSVPADFRMGVSPFAQYGGHATIHVRYDSSSTDVLYQKGQNAPGDNIAYLQLGVPQYRISQMVSDGGEVLDAYGFVNVVSPCGLPMRGIVGIWPDPIMLVAINTADIQQSRAFYEGLGFSEQQYPYSRPGNGTGNFEPMQPPKSVFLAPSKNSMGVLLIPTKKKKATLTPNKVFRSLNLVYTPSEGSEDSGASMQVEDPQNVAISFQSVDRYAKEQASTGGAVQKVDRTS